MLLVMIGSKKHKKREPSLVLSSQKGIAFLVDEDANYLIQLDRELQKILPSIHSKHFQTVAQAMQALDEDPLLIFLNQWDSTENSSISSVIQDFKKLKPSLEIILLTSSTDTKSISSSLNYGEIGRIVKGENALIDVRHNMAAILKKLRIIDEAQEKKQLKKIIVVVAIFVVLAVFTALYLTYG
jgi:response regulator of citrate/malate metabolism